MLSVPLSPNLRRCCFDLHEFTVHSIQVSLQVLVLIFTFLLTSHDFLFIYVSLLLLPALGELVPLLVPLLSALLVELRSLLRSLTQRCNEPLLILLG